MFPQSGAEARRLLRQALTLPIEHKLRAMDMLKRGEQSGLEYGEMVNTLWLQLAIQIDKDAANV